MNNSAFEEFQTEADIRRRLEIDLWLKEFSLASGESIGKDQTLALDERISVLQSRLARLEFGESEVTA